jgi:hypothetical protein
MSIPRRNPEFTELLTANAGAVEFVAFEADDNALSASREEVLIASDDDVLKAVKRVTREHRNLILALAK